MPGKGQPAPGLGIPEQAAGPAWARGAWAPCPHAGAVARSHGSLRCRPAPSALPGALGVLVSRLCPLSHQDPL